MVYDPLVKEGHDVELMVSTYDSAEFENVKNIYNPNHIVLLPSETIKKMKNGPDVTHKVQLPLLSICKTIESEIDHDIIIMHRFDLSMKVPMTELLDKTDPMKYNFLWRECSEEHWIKHRRVSDGIFFIYKHQIDSFKKTFELILKRKCHLHFTLHYLKNHMKIIKSDSEINILYLDGFLDSNTFKCENPYYTQNYKV